MISNPPQRVLERSGVEQRLRSSPMRSRFWRNENTANPDTEILNAARPMLATTGGPLIAITTPYAKRGEPWNIFKRDYGPNGDPADLGG